MNIVKNILGLVVGVIVGGIVNMAIVMLSVLVVDYPGSIDPTDPESIKNAVPLFEAKHYILPFLAHALGTLVGAFVCAKIAASKGMILPMCIGVLFLVGGIMNAMDLGTPMTVNIVDLVFAYIPMAWIGAKLASK